MSRLRAKLASFADYRSYCCGALLEVLADRHNKHCRSLNVEKLVVGAGHIIVALRGIGEANRHVRAVVVLDKLPRAEIVNLLDGEQNAAVHKFVERLARGEVSELVGCMVLEMQAPVAYLDIMEAPVYQESRGELSVQGEYTMLMLVDVYGSCNCFRLDPDLPFSRTHHKWQHVATLDFAQQCKVLPDSAVYVKFFNYSAETGEVVYCTSGSDETVAHLGTPHEVHICSLRFKTNNVIEQSRIMTVGSFDSVVNVLCSVQGFWVVCADLQVTNYRYESCRTYTLDLHFEMLSLNPSFQVGHILAAIHANSDANHSSLYLCVGHTLLCVQWHSGQLQLSGVHRLNRALYHKNNPNTQDTLLQDMHVAVEPHANSSTAVVCVVSSSAVHILQINYPILPTFNVEPTTIQDARLCITLLMPKARSKRTPIVPENVRLVAPNSAPSSLSTLLYVQKGRVVYTITTAGANERSTRIGSRYEPSDVESVVSDVDEIRLHREQTWRGLFPAHHKNASTAEIFLFREGDAEVPITSIHQHTLLREYLHRARSGSDTHESDSRPSSTTGLQHAQYARLSGAVKVLLERVAAGEVSLQELLGRSGVSGVVEVPLTVQTVVDALERTAEATSSVPSQARESRQTCTSKQPSAQADPATPNTVPTSAASWIADLDITTLLPSPQSGHNARLYEFGRCVDPLLVMDLVHSLSPQLSTDEEAGEKAALHSRSGVISAALFYSSSDEKIVPLFVPHGAASHPLLHPSVFAGDVSTAQARATSLDVVLHLLATTRPARFMDVLFCLLEIEQRALHRLSGSPEAPESPVPSLMQKNVPVEDKALPKVRSFRTSIGSAGEGVPQQVVKSHQHHAHQHNQRQQSRSHHKAALDRSMDEDDDLFGLGLSAAVRHAQAQARAPAPVDISVHLQRNRLLGTRNVSTTVFESDGDASLSESQSDSASENSDGDDAFGIFRDVDEDDDEPKSQKASQVNGLTVPAKQSMEVWKVRELLSRATKPLLSPGQAALTTKTSRASGTCIDYVPLLERCEAVAKAVLDTLCVKCSDGSGVDTVQADALLQVLLLCHQPVQVAVYLVKLCQYASLVAFCQRLAASATLLAAESVDSTPSHPVARYVQAVGGARTSARFSTKQNQSESAKWEALLEELYAVSENNLTDTLCAVLTQAETAGVVPTAAQIRLVEYIVTLKLTMRCLLARPEGFKEVVSTVLELVECRPSVVPLETMRAWVNAFAVNGADKSRILLSGILGNR